MFGSRPTYTNTPATVFVCTAPVARWRQRTAETASSPRISSTTACGMISILPQALARSTSARWASRLCERCRTVTREACAASTSASSSAESPPPTTHTSCPAKNGPSHEAQCETPLPSNLSAPATGRPTQSRAGGDDDRGSPQALARAAHDATVAVRLEPFDQSSTNSAPAASACSCSRGPSSWPAIPWGNPGKFSILSALAIWPPAASCSTTATSSP